WTAALARWASVPTRRSLPRWYRVAPNAAANIANSRFQEVAVCRQARLARISPPVPSTSRWAMSTPKSRWVSRPRSAKQRAFRVGHDAGAAAGERCRGALELLHVPAAAAEVRCGQQTAHRAADSERAWRVLSHRHVVSPQTASAHRAREAYGRAAPWARPYWGRVH